MVVMLGDCSATLSTSMALQAAVALAQPQHGPGMLAVHISTPSQQHSLTHIHNPLQQQLALQTPQLVGSTAVHHKLHASMYVLFARCYGASQCHLRLRWGYIIPLPGSFAPPQVYIIQSPP